MTSRPVRLPEHSLTLRRLWLLMRCAESMRAGAKLGHSAPRERCSAAEEKQATAGSCFRELLR